MLWLLHLLLKTADSSSHHTEKSSGKSTEQCWVVKNTERRKKKNTPKRDARKFQWFVLKTCKQILKKILVHPKNHILLEYLCPSSQAVNHNKALPFLPLLHVSPSHGHHCILPLAGCPWGDRVQAKDHVLSCQQAEALLEFTLLLLRQELRTTAASQQMLIKRYWAVN